MQSLLLPARLHPPPFFPELTFPTQQNNSVLQSRAQVSLVPGDVQAFLPEAEAAGPNALSCTPSSHHHPAPPTWFLASSAPGSVARAHSAAPIGKSLSFFSKNNQK